MSKFPLSIAIIGNNGRMGRMFTKRFHNVGLSVQGIDSSLPSQGSFQEALAGTIQQCQVVMLCVPVSALERLLPVLAPLLLPHQILVDITSVKVVPMRLMERYFQGSVVGTHPLFGPAPTPQDMRTILVQGTHASSDHCALVESLFTQIGSQVHWSSAMEHDEGVAFAQSLNFAVSAAFFSTLKHQKNIEHFLTPSFKRHLEAARKHLTEDTAMFLEFSGMNPCFPAALETYAATLERVKKGQLPAVAHEAQKWYSLNKVQGEQGDKG